MKSGLFKPRRLLWLLLPLLGGFLALSLLKTPTAHAATGINQEINFQGRLLNTAGATVPDGFYNIEFKIYQDGDGQTAGDTTGSPAGSLKWTEDYLVNASQGVKVQNGYLSVELGSVTPFGSNIDWNQSTLWLSMDIAGTGSCTPFSSCSPDGEMVPMQPMTAAPYALNAGELNGITAANFVQLAQGVQTDSSTANASIFINKTGTTANILDLQRGGVDVLKVDNTGDTTFKPFTSSDSTSFFQIQNASGKDDLNVDTSGGIVALGNSGASGVTGDLKFNFTGVTGSISLVPLTPSSTNYTINLPAESGTLCTTASTGVCNTAGGLSNVAYLNATAQTFSGQNTFNRTGSGSNDYTLGLTGTPSASSTSSLVRLGNAITGGNGAANGGTYLGINESSSGAGSAADFADFQNGTTVELQVTAGGAVTANGTYNTNTFNGNTLTFGTNGNASISSSAAGSDNLSVDTGATGGSLNLGNTAGTTNLGNSNAAHTINIGTGSAGTTTQAITIGEATNSSSTLTLQGGNGSGAVTLQTGNNGSSAGTIQIGNTAGAFAQTISIGNNANATNNVNIGTGTAGNSVTIGSSGSSTNTVTINGGTASNAITLGASTTLAANQNFTYATGTGKFDAHNATGTFDTSTGANSLNGATTVTGTNTFTVNGGATVLNGATAGSATAAKVNTNAASNIGLVIQGASGQTSSLLQLQDSTGAAVQNFDVLGDQEALGYLNTPFGGLGSYGNMLTQSEAFNNGGGTPWTYTNVTTPSANTAVAPDGNTTAESLATTSSGGKVTQSVTGTNTTYTFSVWLKATSAQGFALRIDSNGTPATGTAFTASANTTWQRYSVTQAFSSGVTTVTPSIFPGGTAGSGTIQAWGAQLVVGSTPQVYTGTTASAVATTTGLSVNGNTLIAPVSDSTAAFVIQNAANVNELAVDTSNNQLVLGTAGAGGITGSEKFNFTGASGSISLTPLTPSSTNYVINLPAENGTLCTSASTSACSTAGAGYVQLAPASAQGDGTNNNSIFINKTSGTGNIVLLEKSTTPVFTVDNSGNVTSTGQNTLSRNGAGSNDYTLGVTGTPSASSTSSLLRLGNAITGGNGAANGGTYLGINESSSGAGSAADFLDFQNGTTIELQVSSGGAVTANGTYNTNTFNGNTLTFGTNGAATINSNGANNLTVDTGSSGGTESLGNNASATNIGTTNAAHTIQIGTGAAGTTTQAVTIGEATNSSSTLTLQGGNGTGAISLLTGNNGTTAGSIQIGNTTGAFAQTISIGNNANATNTVNIGTGTAGDSVTIGSSGSSTNTVTINAGTGSSAITLGASTTVAANQNVSFAAGSGKFDAHTATGTFDTSTGANSLNGATTVTGTNTFTVNGGATVLNGATAGGGTAAKINTNAANNIGLVIQGASSQTAALFSIQDSTGANLQSFDVNGNQEQVGYLNTPFGGLGAYSNMLTQSEAFNNGSGAPWTYTNVTTPTANNSSSNAPDGNATAEALATTSSGGSVKQTVTGTNTTYTFSVWLKATSSQGFALRIDSNGTPATGTAFTGSANTTWQRYSVTQTFSSGVTTVSPTIFPGGTAGSGTIQAWGAQLVVGSTPQVYVGTTANAVAATTGLSVNGNTTIAPVADSTTAFQIQNAANVNELAVDTSNNQLVLGTAGASGITGSEKFNFTGASGSISLTPLTPGSSSFVINLPAENGTLCTTAATGTCSVAGSGYIQLAPTSVQADGTNNNTIFINKTSGTGNIVLLEKSTTPVFTIDNSGNVTSTGQNTLSRNGTGTNDYTLGLTGAPTASGSSSLLRLGNALTAGNSVSNGGTYLGIQAPTSGAGSAADFVDFQGGATTIVQFQVTAGGAVTANGTYNTNTFNGNTLTFGTNGAASITSSAAGSNNLSVDTGASGGTLNLGNTAGTTDIGTTNAAHTIAIGTGAGGTTTQAVTLGEATNSSSTLTLQGGNGTGAVSLLTGNNGTTAGSIQVGNTAGAFSQTINIGTNATAGSANVVNIGTGSGATVGDSVAIGNSTDTTNTVTINAGTGANAISLNGNTTVGTNDNFTLGTAAGSGNFDAHNSTGTFQTSSGNNTLNGNTTVSSGKTFSVAGGASTLTGNSGGSATAVAISTGATSNIGLTIQGASGQTSSLFEMQDSTGAIIQNFDVLGDHEQLGYLDTPFGGLGTYANLLLQSEAFDNASWTKTSVTNPTANTVAAPDGNTTAESLADSASGGSVSQASTTAVGSTYTFSVWIKATSAQVFSIRIDGSTSGTGTAFAGTANTTWQRYTVTQNTTGFAGNVKALIFPGGTGTTGTVSAWGAQLVAGSTAQVYAASGTAAVSATDGLAVNGVATFQPASNSTDTFSVQNASGASIFVVDSTDRHIRIFENGGTTNYAEIYYDTASSTANYTANTGTVAVGAGASGISINSGTSSSITITSHGTSTWGTTVGALTIQSATGLTLSNANSAVTIGGSSQVLLGQASSDGTCNVGAIDYNTSTHTLRGCQGSTPAWNDLINLTTPTLQQSYTASTGSTTPEIKLDTTRGSLDIQGDNAGAVTDLLEVRAGAGSGLGTSLLDVDSSGDLSIQSASGIATLSTSGSDVEIGSTSGHSSDPVVLVLDNYQPTTAGAEPTEQDGAMYYDADENQFRCGYDGAWSDCGINSIQSSYVFQDEFLGGTANTTVGTSITGVGELGWNVTPSTSCTETYNNTLTADHDHPGFLKLTAGASTSDGCTMTQGGSAATGTGGLDTILSAGDTFKAAVAVDNAANIMRIGWSNATGNSASAGAYWQISGSNLQYCFNSTCATATTVTANQWIELEIYVNATNNITFVSNISGAQTSNTTTSAFTTTGLGPFATCFPSTSATRSCYIDYIQWSGYNTDGNGIRD